MSEGAPRRPLRLWQHLTRGGLTGLCLWLAAAGASWACRGEPVQPRGALASSVVHDGAFTAWYSDLTRRYAHAALGDDQEPTTLGFLNARNSASCGTTVTLSPPLVFEDVAPRLADLTGDGIPEIITVRSHADLGAQLAIYTLSRDKRRLRLLTATPHIGTRFRWLAPVGAADFDGDGQVEIAFVDRPHLDRVLRVWRYTGGRFFEIGQLAGLTNHRFGEDFITGGVRDCGTGPEMVVMDEGWTWIMAVRVKPDRIFASRIAPFAGPASVDDALICR